jgi:acetylornithine aminotransferase/acetylornithine/N-succinyldiaminopimelate aminotransferase
MILDKGEGMKVWDLEGKQYYDFIGGIAVNALGYGYPKLVQAMKNQAEKLIHCSNLYYSEPQIILAQMLIELSCGDKVFFGNSGAEVNEGAIKLAVKYFKDQNKDKHKIIYMKNSFHGRTIATLAATGQHKYQKDYLPLLPKFKEAIFNDLESVKTAVDEEVAAVLVEPIQGEGGVKIATQEFIKGLRELCNKEGILLIFDEIQCGLGRTGKMFAYQHFNVEPDILTLAKSLGGGIPIGAIIAKDKIASSFKPGDHGTTFGGNPVACAMAIAFIKVLEEEDLIGKCQKKGEYFKDKLKGLKEKYPEKIEEVRGLGLMVGMELKEEGQEIVKKCVEEGVLINCAAKKVLRFLPPLIVKEKEIDYLVGILGKVFQG